MELIFVADSCAGYFHPPTLEARERESGVDGRKIIDCSRLVEEGAGGSKGDTKRLTPFIRGRGDLMVVVWSSRGCCPFFWLHRFRALMATTVTYTHIVYNALNEPTQIPGAEHNLLGIEQNQHLVVELGAKGFLRKLAVL